MVPAGLNILGFGGHARSVADVALDLGILNICFIEPGAKPAQEFMGFPVEAVLTDRLSEGWYVFPAEGDNAKRQSQFENIVFRGFRTQNLISKRAYLGMRATVGAGSFVAHHAHVGPLASIGRGTIVNTAAVVDHDSQIGDYSHISVNATVAGKSVIGNSVFLGAGATVIDRVRITDHVTIGAGATVIADITEPGVYVGCPARRVG